MTTVGKNLFFRDLRNLVQGANAIAPPVRHSRAPAAILRGVRHPTGRFGGFQ